VQDGKEKEKREKEKAEIQKETLNEGSNNAKEINLCCILEIRRGQNSKTCLP